MQKLNFKKHFLVVLIIALILSAFVGIYIFLIGDFSQTETNILFTTLGLAVYSLLGLCSAMVYGKKRLNEFSIVGMSLSFLAFVGAVDVLWQIIEFDGEARLFLLMTIFSFSFAHASLMLLLNIKFTIVKYALYSTFFFILLVAIMLSYIVVFSYDTEGLFLKLLGVFAILDVLGSVVTPLLNFIKAKL